MRATALYGDIIRAQRNGRYFSITPMLIWLANFLQQDYGFLRVFSYITFRAIGAAFTAVAIGLLAGPAVIRRLVLLKMGQAVRLNGPANHLKKDGTPTMGGILILISIASSVLLWADLQSRFIWPALIVTLGFGAVGWVDDYRKVTKKDPQGMRSAEKYFWMSLVGVFASVYLVFAISGGSPSGGGRLFVQWVASGFDMGLPSRADLIVPFFKATCYPLGAFGFIALTYCVIVGSSNAVNFTDGLDGLAILPTVMVGAALGLFAYLTGDSNYSAYLYLPHVPGAGELLIFCAALVGAGLAFLWFNAFPAQMFMGDVGALALGGALGVVAVIVRQEIVLFMMGGVFVAETLSVIVQVGWFKFTRKRFGTGRRIFLMAPLHHHFEQKGWPETKVVVRFWIVSFLLVLFGLSTLKIR